MKLGNASPSDIESQRRYSAEDVRILWADDFYDGPLQGIAEINGERVLYDIVDRNALGNDEDF